MRCGCVWAKTAFGIGEFPGVSQSLCHEPLDLKVNFVHFEIALEATISERQSAFEMNNIFKAFEMKSIFKARCSP